MATGLDSQNRAGSGCVITSEIEQAVVYTCAIFESSLESRLVYPGTAKIFSSPPPKTSPARIVLIHSANERPLNGKNLDSALYN